MYLSIRLSIYLSIFVRHDYHHHHHHLLLLDHLQYQHHQHHQHHQHPQHHHHHRNVFLLYVHLDVNSFSPPPLSLSPPTIQYHICLYTCICIQTIHTHTHARVCVLPLGWTVTFGRSHQQQVCALVCVCVSVLIDAPNRPLYAGEGNVSEGAPTNRTLPNSSLLRQKHASLNPHTFIPHENNVITYYIDTPYFSMIHSYLTSLNPTEELFLNQDDFLAFSHRLNLMTYQALEDFAAWSSATRGGVEKQTISSFNWGCMKKKQIYR